MSKLITVFGATGIQGGSVVTNLLADPQLSKEFKIRGVTRDASKPAAKELESKGVEVVSADMNSVESALAAIQGSHTVFFVTNFWQDLSMENEIKHGKNVTDAAVKAGVQHLIFSSLTSITDASNGKITGVLHFDGKAEIEKYIRKTGIPATFVMPASYMSFVLDTFRKQDDGSYALFVPGPADETIFPLIDTAPDYGKFVAAAIKNRSSVLGERIYAAENYYSATKMADIFSEATGHPAKAIGIPPEAFQKNLPPAIASELTDMMVSFSSPGYYGGADLKESLALLDANLTSLKEYLTVNKSKFQ